MDFSAVIVAAGSSTRAGPGAPKPWRSLGGRPILSWSIDAFAAAGARQIVVVVADGWIDEAAELLEATGLPASRMEPVERHAFYERVRQAYAIVVTGEPQPWGNFILRKGVLGESLRP